MAAKEAAARDPELGPEHLLVGLLRDAQEPLESTPTPMIGGCGACSACAIAVPTRSGCWWRREGSRSMACSRPRSTSSIGTGEAARLVVASIG
jgi:hypothetical protein